MNIATTRQKANKKTRSNARRTPEDRFEYAWQQVIKQQKQNDKFERDLKELAEQIEIQLREPELQRAQAFFDTCTHLLKFVDYKTLGQRQRVELLEWCAEYCMEISANPFAGTIDIEPLRQRCHTALEMHFQAVLDPDDGDTDTDSNRKRQYSDNPADDLFAGFEDDESDEFKEDGSARFEEAFYEYFFEQQSKEEAQRMQESKALNQLLKSSSINRLFRRIARVIHPDREQDENLKADKNQQMGELIDARDQNDIPKIFALYAEHVGESPTTEIADDLDSVTLILEQQKIGLKTAKLDFLHQNPFLAMVHKRFYRRTKKARQQALAEHLDELEGIIEDEILMIKDIRNLTRLKSILNERMSRHKPFHEFFEY